MVRPLLLQQSNDPAQLTAVRAICEREAEAGDPVAIYQLSFFHLGLGGFDAGAAEVLMRRAAGLDVAEAQYWLAWQRETGPLLENDRAEALQWYQRAAENEHPLALYRLAEAYENGGLGLPADSDRAMSLRTRARRCASEFDARGNP